MRNHALVRWLRALGVGLVLAAPVAVVVALAWPSTPEEVETGARGAGSGPDGALVVGDELDDELGFGEVAEYRLVGDARQVRIGVRGEPPMDATLRVLDADGAEVAFNDDHRGLDPEVSVRLDGELLVQVAELSGSPGAYHLYVE